MLSSNKIQVVALNDLKDTIGASDKSELKNNEGAITSSTKLNVSEMILHINGSQNNLPTGTQVVKINEIDKLNNIEADKSSSNWIEIEPDLSKEPRIEKDKNVNESEEKGTTTKVLGDDPAQSRINNEADAQTTQHVIPTFFNKKIQDAIYNSSNGSDISSHSSSNIDTTSRPHSSITEISTTGSSNSEDENIEDYISLKIPQNPSCGKLGGAAIFQAFGKLSQKLMPNLVANWVTGQNGKQQKDKDKRARIDLSGEFDKEGTEPRIIAGILFYIIKYSTTSVLYTVRIQDLLLLIR